jgi:ATPase subunit of ABC transporter with duplicated ATPase domains
MKGLGKTYPGGREVLKDIRLSFLPGAKIGVLALNGAGKSILPRNNPSHSCRFSNTSE